MVGRVWICGHGNSANVLMDSQANTVRNVSNMIQWGVILTDLDKLVKEGSLIEIDEVKQVSGGSLIYIAGVRQVKVIYLTNMSEDADLI